MTPFDALSELPNLVEDYKRTAAELARTQRELALLKDDGYVGWGWVCQYLDVTEPVARKMLAEVKIMIYGRKVKKFRRSDIVRFAEKNSIKVKDLSA